MRQQTDNSGRIAATIGLLAMLLTVVFVFVGIGVWWIESRFGAGVAVAVLGGSLAIAAFTGGAAFAHRLNRRALEAAGDLVASTSDAFRANAGVVREYAKGASAWQVAGAKAQLVDHQSGVRDEDRRVRLLVDAERRRLEQEYSARVAAVQPQAAPAWLVEDDAGGGVRFVE